MLAKSVDLESVFKFTSFLVEELKKWIQLFKAILSKKAYVLFPSPGYSTYTFMNLLLY